MQPDGIITCRITVLDPPTDLRTWTCHAFFVPAARPNDLHEKIKQQHIDLTQVEGGCWVYGGRHLAGEGAGGSGVGASALH